MEKDQLEKTIIQYILDMKECKILDLNDVGLQEKLLGKSYLADFNLVLPGKGVTSGVMLRDYIGLKFKGGGITQTMIGEVYVNFGLLPSFLISFSMSVGLSLLHIQFIIY